MRVEKRSHKPRRGTVPGIGEILRFRVHGDSLAESLTSMSATGKPATKLLNALRTRAGCLRCP
jgi:hypothetical protein